MQVVRQRRDRLVDHVLEVVHGYSLAMGRGSRPIRRWRNDRQRKKKARELRTAERKAEKK
jgi:hypothetical protein